MNELFADVPSIEDDGRALIDSTINNGDSTTQIIITVSAIIIIMVIAVSIVIAKTISDKNGKKHN